MMYFYDLKDPESRWAAEERAYQHRLAIASVMADLERKERRTRRIANVVAFLVWAVVTGLVWRALS